MDHIALTLRQLYDGTQDAQKRKSRNSRIVSIQQTKKKFPTRFTFLVKSKEQYSSPKGWLTTIGYPELSPDLIKKGSTPLNLNVKVWCTCPAFLYYGSDYWSTRFDFSLKPGQDIRPKIRDPQGRNLVCKHIIRAMAYMSKKGFNYLIRRFRSSSLSYDSQELYPYIANYLRFQNYSDENIDDILFSLNEENAEDVLEELGFFG